MSTISPIRSGGKLVVIVSPADLDELRDLGEHLRVRELGAQREQHLLLARRTVEVVVAGGIARPDVRERLLAVELVLAGLRQNPRRPSIQS